MVCPYCRGETQVVNSRPKHRTNSVWRRRRCLACGSVTTTEEAVRYESALMVQNSNGGLTPFSRDKLLVSLHKSLAHRSTAITDAAALTDTLISQLRTDTTGAAIELVRLRELALTILGRFDELAGSHYRAYHLPRP